MRWLNVYLYVIAIDVSINGTSSIHYFFRNCSINLLVRQFIVVMPTSTFSFCCYCSTSYEIKRVYQQSAWWQKGGRWRTGYNTGDLASGFASSCFYASLVRMIQYGIHSVLYWITRNLLLVPSIKYARLFSTVVLESDFTGL